jgi:hypothetical protein
MKFYIKFLEKISVKKYIFAFLFLFILFQLIFMFVLIPNYTLKTGNESIPDMNFLYDYEYIREIISNINKDYSSYLNVQILDLIFPLIYFLFLSTSIFYFKKINILKYNFFLFLPLLGAIFDYLENLFIFSMIKIYPNQFNVLAFFTSYISFIKFIFLGLSFLLILILIIFYFYKKLKKQHD